MQVFLAQVTALTPLSIALAFVVFTVYQFLKLKSDKKDSAKVDLAREQGVASEVITAYKEQVNQLKDQGNLREERFQKVIKEQTDSFNAQINALTGKIGELTGQINEKNKQLEFFKELFENRNPELEEFIKSSRTATEALTLYMKESSIFFKELHTFMQESKTKK